MPEEELQMEDGGKKRKMIIIIVVVVLLLAAGGGAFFFMGDSEEAMPAQGTASETGDIAETAAFTASTALYVAMPRPFVFNVAGSTRDRLVEIRVQLMVRGSDYEEQVKAHIPLIEGTLLSAFSMASADDLVTEAGKITIRDSALKAVQKKMQEITGKQMVEQVLFTGFVMQ